MLTGLGAKLSDFVLKAGYPFLVASALRFMRLGGLAQQFRKTARIFRLGRNFIFSSDRCPAFLLSEPPISSQSSSLRRARRQCGGELWGQSFLMSVSSFFGSLILQPLKHRMGKPQSNER